MRPAIRFLLAFALAGLGARVKGVQLANDVTTPRVVHQKIHRRQVEDLMNRDQRRLKNIKRGMGAHNGAIRNEGSLYTMEISIGTPEQKFHVLVDTGGFNLWVNAKNSTLCSQSPCKYGTYDANSSTTYNYSDSMLWDSYLDGREVTGDYATDILRVAGVTLQNQQFGIAYTVNGSFETGVFGIGYPDFSAGTENASIPFSLAKAGHINTMAYSMWLNCRECTEANLLFGGIDTEKYQGELHTIPVVPIDGDYDQPAIPLQGVGFNGDANGLIHSDGVNVILDSGTFVNFLPEWLTSRIYDAVGVRYNNATGEAVIDCERGTSEHTLDFRFGSEKTIRVPMSELVMGGVRGCTLAVVPHDPWYGDSHWILGDTFLRSAYVVYDYSKNEISIAQTEFNSTKDHIVELTGNSSMLNSSMLNPSLPRDVVDLAVPSR